MPSNGHRPDGGDEVERRLQAMTAGMDTRNLEAGRISLPRAGLGALLAGTLIAGGLLGAAAYATASMINANAAAHAAAISVALPRESTTVRDSRIAAGNGQLAGDTRGAAVTSAAITAGAIRQGQVATGNGPLAGDVRGLPSGTTGVQGVTRTTSFPVGRDGFGYDQASAPAPTVAIQHPLGRGPLQ
jgi:hypothetical protein